MDFIKVVIRYFRGRCLYCGEVPSYTMSDPSTIYIICSYGSHRIFERKFDVFQEKP